ncbi:hypothetical protein B0H11DRAFT_2266815 [Mycena galericulata]|nr:hypothetical protein B0H11DRAFT_2266815 [Mycena galericulata]
MDDAVRLNNLRESYHKFNDDVLSALRVMVGDPPRLNAVRDRGLALASAAEQHRLVFPPAEYGVLQTSISDMVTALDLACHESMDPPDAGPLVVARRHWTFVAPPPGAPVFQYRINAEGGVDRLHTSSTPPVSSISDAELDQLLAATLEIFLSLDGE